MRGAIKCVSLFCIDYCISSILSTVIKEIKTLTRPQTKMIFVYNIGV